jgi:hypothetical protein
MMVVKEHRVEPSVAEDMVVSSKWHIRHHKVVSWRVKGEVQAQIQFTEPKSFQTSGGASPKAFPEYSPGADPR